MGKFEYNLQPVKVDTNLAKFIDGSPKEKKMGTSQSAHFEKMGRLYVSQLNKLMEVQELDPESMPGYATYIGTLEAVMNCTRKTVRNRLKHYEECGAIIKRENHGKNGIRIWFHPDIIFANQKGFENYTSTTVKSYVSDQTHNSGFSPGSATTTESDTPSEKNFLLNESSDNIEKKPSCPKAQSVKFTPLSSCQELINTNTAHVNNYSSANPEELEGVPQAQGDIALTEPAQVLEEQNVLPVPSGKGENPRTHPRTLPGTKQSSQKNLRQSEVAPKKRAPQKTFSEPHIPKKDNQGGPGRTFLLQLIQSFWSYAKKRLYPGIILLESEERIIKNHIWCSVFLKLPEGHTEESWRDFYLKSCKKVDKAVNWLEINPSFELPPPEWYFHPKNTRGVGFYKMGLWQSQDERNSVITKIKREVNQYAKGKGRYRDRSPLELFRKHERYVRAFNDPPLNAMFNKMAQGGGLYQYLKQKQKV